jgi:putative MFS transporter
MNTSDAVGAGTMEASLGHSVAERDRASPGLAHLDNLSAINSLRRRALLIVSAGELVDGYDLVIVGGALLLLKPQFHLSPAEVGYVGAAAYVGAFLGQLWFGNLADRIGRRAIYVFNLLAFAGLAILSALVTNPGELIAIRVLLGLAIGADIPTSMAYLNEISPRQSRGRWGSVLPNWAWCIGAVVAAFLWVPLLGLGANAWRVGFALAAVPAFLVWLARRTLPESPRWLMRQGRVDEARSVLTALGVSNAELAPPSATPRAYLQLFRPPLVTRTGLVSLLFILNGLAAPITTIATPFILHYVGLFSIRSSLIFSALVWVANLAGASVCWLLIDRVGRRRLVIPTQIGAGLCAVAMGLFGHGRPGVLVTLFFVFGFLQWMGAIPAQWLWGSELFPTRLRAAGQGVGNGLNRLAIAGNIYLVPVATAALGFTPLILLFSVLVFGFAAVVAGAPFFATEGKSLEEINPEAAASG